MHECAAFRFGSCTRGVHCGRLTLFRNRIYTSYFLKTLSYLVIPNLSFKEHRAFPRIVNKQIFSLKFGIVPESGVYKFDA